MNMNFLSQQNFEHIRSISQRLLIDMFQLNMVDVLTPARTDGIIQDIMRQVQRDNTGSIETLNKMALAKIKDRALYENKLSLVSASQLPLPVSPSQPSQTPVKGLESISTKDDDGFFNERLQELEQKRQAATVASISTQQTVEVKSSTDVLLPKVQASNIPHSIATVFMPMPPRRGQELIINSWQRNWLSYPQRNGYLWMGPMPSGVDLSMTRVACVLLPRHVIRLTPYVVLQLEGVGNTQVSMVLVPEKVSSDATWVTYRPSLESLGYLKAIATPWTIRVFTANGQMLPLGMDGHRVDYENQVFQCIESKDKDYYEKVKKGDQIWIFGNKGEIHSGELVALETENQNGMEAFRIRSHEGKQFTSTSGQLLNFSEQWSIVLDCHRRSS